MTPDDIILLPFLIESEMELKPILPAHAFVVTIVKLCLLARPTCFHQQDAYLRECNHHWTLTLNFDAEFRLVVVG